MSDLTPGQLHTALRIGAASIAELAAVDLLITGAPYLLTPDRPDVMACLESDVRDDDVRYLVVDWQQLAEQVRTGQIPTSRSEAQIVGIAASLTEPGPLIALGRSLSALDDVRAGAVLGAIRAVLTGGA